MPARVTSLIAEPGLGRGGGGGADSAFRGSRMSPWEVATTSTACCPWEGIGQWVCKENAFRSGRWKQRGANKPLRIRCTAANGEVPGGDHEIYPKFP